MKLESTLTDRFQTTVPNAVRHALQLGKRDKVRYILRPDGTVLMTRAENDPEDPVLGRFLDFLAQDMKTHPEQLRTISTGLRKRIRSAIGKVDVDLNEALSPDDE